MSAEQSTESMAAGIIAIPFALAVPLAKVYAAWLIYGWHLVPLGAPVVSFDLAMVLYGVMVMLQSDAPTAAERAAAEVAPKLDGGEFAGNVAALYVVIGLVTWLAWWLA